MNISRDEWLSALNEAGVSVEDDSEAVTVAEFCQLFSLRRQAGVSRLEALVAAGKATRTRKRAPTSEGKMVSYIAYRLV